MKPDSITITRLLQQPNLHATTLFNEMDKRFRKRFVAFANCVIPQKAQRAFDGEDAVQRAMLEMFSAPQNLGTNRKSLFQNMMQKVKYRALDLLRKQKEHGASQIGSPASQILDPQRAVEEALSYTSACPSERELYNALQELGKTALKQACESPALSHWLAGKSLREIAELLGERPTTIRAQVLTFVKPFKATVLRLREELDLAGYCVDAANNKLDGEPALLAAARVVTHNDHG